MYFVKVTWKNGDGSPVFLNAAFIVSMQPTKARDSVQINLSNGVSLTVKETLEEIGAMIRGGA